MTEATIRTDHWPTRLDAQLARATRRRSRSGLPAPQILVTGPGLRWERGDLAQRFHCASIDKVMTATLVARLVEQGRFAFDSPLGAVLPAAQLRGLPAAEGVDLARDVTVEHLLSHTSGLPDYADPPRGQRSAAAIARWPDQPDRRWTREELFDVTRRLRAVGRPGDRFHYCDTAYLLLGRVAEEAAGQRYSALLAEQLFAPTGMSRTSAPFDDELTSAGLAALDLAPIRLGRHDLTRSLCLTAGWGSVVTVADDLVRFQQALHGGALIRPEHLARLAGPRHRLRPGVHYGAGLVTLRFAELVPPPLRSLLRGLPEPVGGLGISASHLFYYPQQRAHVVLNFHSTGQLSASFRTQLAIARALARR